MTREERHIAVLNRMLESMDVYDSIQPTTERKKAIKAAIQALSQESEIEENIIKYMKKYPNHVGNIDFWEGFYACRNVVLQLDDEECSPKEQEPKSIIREAIEDYVCNYLTDTAKAQEILNALQDMEHEPIECDDAVSREAVIDLYDRYRPSLATHVSEFGDELKALPSVTQKSGKWIPVSERLPEAFRFVNCTCHSLIDDRKDWVVETCYLPQLSDSPYSDWGNIPMLNMGDCEVVAWMYRDIPKPYKVEPQERSEE